jgi:hypothetical protein
MPWETRTQENAKPRSLPSRSRRWNPGANATASARRLPVPRSRNWAENRSRSRTERACQHTTSNRPPPFSPGGRMAERAATPRTLGLSGRVASSPCARHGSDGRPTSKTVHVPSPSSRSVQVSGNGRSSASSAAGVLGHVEASRGKSLARRLDDFAVTRRESLRELNALHLGREDLERRGRHPALGVVTLSELLATWAAHDLTHLHQITRIMAHQYREAVGPWSRFLGVLQCAGHSSP